MKGAIQQAVRSLIRSDFSARGDAARAESRARVARMSAEGRSWEGLRENVALLGIEVEAGSRPKMLFGAKR